MTAARAEQSRGAAATGAAAGQQTRVVLVGRKARQTCEQVQDLPSSPGESHPVSLSRAYVEFGLFVLTAAGGRELESFGKLKEGGVVQWLAGRAGREPPAAAAAQPVFGEQQLCFVPSTVVLSTLERGPKTCPALQNQHSTHAVAYLSVKKSSLGERTSLFLS